MHVSKTLVLALVFAAAVPSVAIAGPGVGSMTLNQVLKEVQKRQGKVRTLQATFVQKKTLGLLASPQVAHGLFAYEKPDKVRWDYREPNSITMVIAGGKMTTYYQKLNRAESMEVGRFQDRIFKYMGAGNAIKELATYFNFKFTDRKGEATWKLELTPKTSQVAKRVKGISIWFDRKTFLTSAVEYVEADGDVTRYEFTQIRVNETVPASSFIITLPPTVKVERMKLD